MEKRRMGLDALRPGEYGVLREILMPGEAKARMEAVSYTHLTLPTNSRV